jgi:hypothetical protein
VAARKIRNLSNTGEAGNQNGLPCLKTRYRLAQLDIDFSGFALCPLAKVCALFWARDEDARPGARKRFPWASWPSFAGYAVADEALVMRTVDNMNESSLIPLEQKPGRLEDEITAVIV